MPRGQPAKGQCAYCGAEISKSGTTKHLSACAKRQLSIATAAQKKGGSETLYHLRVQDAWRNEFWRAERELPPLQRSNHTHIKEIIFGRA